MAEVTVVGGGVVGLTSAPELARAVVRGRGVVPGTRLGVVARTVDVMPTALDLLGLVERTPKEAPAEATPA